MHARPPEMIENSAELNVATAPDSRAPSRGPPRTTAICTDVARLRNRSCTESCKTVSRSTADITAAQPVRASNTRAAHRARTNPNATMTPPQAQTAIVTAQVRRRMLLSHPVANAPTSAAGGGCGIEVAKHARAAVEDRTGQLREQSSWQTEHGGAEVDQEHTLQDLAGSNVPEAVGRGTKARSLARRAGGSPDMASTVAVLIEKMEEARSFWSTSSPTITTPLIGCPYYEALLWGTNPGHDHGPASHHSGGAHMPTHGPGHATRNARAHPGTE